VNIIFCLLYLILTGLVFFGVGRLIPYSWFNENKFPFSCCPVEKGGNIYLKLGIKKWQNKVPDMSKIFSNIMETKSLSNKTLVQIPVMIKETCVSEFTHCILCITGLGCMIIYKGIGGLIISLLNICGNSLFIMIQRYNRPRLIKYLSYIER